MVTVRHQESLKLIQNYSAARRVQDALTTSTSRKSISGEIESTDNTLPQAVQMERLSVEDLEGEQRWDSNNAQSLICWTLVVVLIVFYILASVLVITALPSVRLIPDRRSTST